MGILRVYLAGRLLIETGQGSLVDHTRSSDAERIALALLVIERHRPVAITEIAEALWDDGRRDNWRETLTAALERLAASFERLSGIGLEQGSDLVRLTLPRDVWVDVEHAHGALERATVAVDAGDVDRAVVLSTAAAVIGKRPFLPGLESRWVRAQRSSHRANFVAGLLLRSRAALRSGAPEEAVRIARRALDHDAFHEPALRALMHAMDAAGDRVGALRAYEEYRAAVARHPGAAPTQETEELASDIRAPRTSRLDQLTPRQREVASLVAAGLTNRQIAERLVISVQTAETHVKHILTRLGLSSRSQVAALVATDRRTAAAGD